jgi:S1-C subfamily serine protease
VSLAGLRHALKRALDRHRVARPAPPQARKPMPRTVDDFSATKRLPPRSCVHCHQVYDLRRASLQEAGKWRLDEVWVYPMPENVGLKLDIDEGDQVAGVGRGSAADRAGLRKGDRLTAIAGREIASFADVQYALHRAPASGKIEVAWARAGKQLKGELTLGPGWRKTDVSWRWSLRGVGPSPGVQGDDLTVAEKKALRLPAARLAFRQGGFVSAAARQAGIRSGDVVLGVDGKQLEMTAQQFAAHIRLGYKVGDRVSYNLLRDGKRIDVKITLQGR